MINYLLLRIVVFWFSLLPFRALYFLSDGIAFLMYRVFRYRYAVIYSNLKNTFPHKNDAEIERIIEKTYVNLSDVIVESIKGMTLDLPELVRRYHFKNPEIADRIYQKNLSAIGLVSHYNNWEWGAFATASQLNFHVTGVFKPLKNKRINHYLLKARSRFNTQIISMNQTGRALIENRNNPTLFVLIADQSPSNLEHVFWVDFLNRDTACFEGPEKIARRMNYPVLHFAIERVKRGFYEIEVSVLFENPQTIAPGQITQTFMQTLENQIHHKPENWLWSHRRWKHQRKIKDRRHEPEVKGQEMEVRSQRTRIKS